MSDLDQFKARFRQLLELRVQSDIDKVTADKSSKEYREYEAELWEEVKEAGIQGSLTFDFGADLGKCRFTARQPTIYGRVLDKDTAIAALRAEGLDDVIYESAVREGRLNELVRDRMESGDSLPDGVDYYDRKGITITRRK